MLLTSAFSKENSVISLEEWVSVFKVPTTATRKLRVNPIRTDSILSDHSVLWSVLTQRNHSKTNIL